MSYIFIIVMAIVIFFAVKKQNSFKGKMGSEKFYGKESLEIAKTIIPTEDEITFYSCGTNMDTYTKAKFKGSASGSTTQDFKNIDYTIVAKTTKNIYFIPVKIVGFRKLNLEINPKIKIETYDLLNVRHKITEEKPNATWPSIDIEFNINNNSTHNVQFRDSYNEFKPITIS